MSKIITIKLVSSSPNTGPFTISDLYGNIIASDVTKDAIIAGVSYSVDDNIDMVRIESTGRCKLTKIINVTYVEPIEYASVTFTETKTACLWRHLTNITIYNNYYGKIEPYIIEYPFAYDYHDEILQNVKDFTKAYKYLPDGTGVFSYTDKIEVDNQWFNKAVLYNGQQSSGILELVPKPMHNLKAYLSYPIFNAESKTITYTKSDSFYQYNTFWNVVKSKSEKLFLTSCESLSIDKIVNQANMDYGTRSFRKDTLRAKSLKVRHILDNNSDVSLVSRFIYTPAQISYK